MKQDTRLDKIERLLTPKQAVILWLREIQHYRNAKEYLQLLRGQPESARPLYKITKQISQTTRDSMKNQPQQVVENAVYRATRDVCFLVKLQQQVNAYQMQEERVWNLMFVALEGNLRAIMQENHYQFRLSNLSSLYSQEIPYPVDRETADNISAAIRNHVTTWDQLKDDNTLEEWFCHYLLDHGEKEIPEGAYTWVDGKFKPNITLENENEVKALFKDDIEFERFKVGEDYTNLWATVKDADYTAHYDQMVLAIHELVDSGNIQKGTLVYLDTVPIPFLQFATLVEGEWLDRYVMALAEAGAMLADKGYQIQETNDHHPLARPNFLDSNNNEIDRKEIGSLLIKVDRHLKKFPGRTKKIDGRLYINFEDYSAWRGRKVKDDLSACVSEGFLTASWDTWVEAKKGKSELAGVPVERLECYVQEHDYLLYADGTEEQIKRRDSLVNITSKKESPKADEEVDFWKEMAGTLLLNLHGFRQAVTTIKQRYFDGEEIMFSDSVHTEAELSKYTEELIIEYNGRVAKQPEDKLDLAVLETLADKTVTGRVSYLVDMAKAEALDALGENRAAVELIERHLEA
ncbi:MAG: hypothetical protein WAU62_08610 [Dehalococcoidales bacterium]